MEELEKQKPVETVFRKTFERVDTIILEKVKPTPEDIVKAGRRPPDSKGGSTATIAFIQEKSNAKWLHIANVGDSGAVLCRNGQAIVLTKEDKTTNPEEKKRLEDGECSIWKNRVWGTLAITRSFGDLEFKQWVISEPHFQSIKLNKDDSFLIMACDGVTKKRKNFFSKQKFNSKIKKKLWDVVSPQDAVNLISKEKLSAKERSEILVNFALNNGSTDNITVIVILL